MRDDLLEWAASIQVATGKRIALAKDKPIPDWNRAALNPMAAELVGWRLARDLGIGTAPSVRVVPLAEARAADPRQWIAKVVATDGRLKANFGPCSTWGSYVLLVEKIPGAITLFHLHQFYGVADPLSAAGWSLGAQWKSPFNQLRWGDRLSLVWRDVNAKRREAIEAIVFGKESVPDARSFYADFVPPEDWAPVRRAIAQNSDQALAIHAMRLFLAASTAHRSNVLVNVTGKLCAIDFEICTRTDGEEIDLVFQNVARGTRAFAALAGVARLSENQVGALFDGLPACPGWPMWPLGSKAKTAECYLARLRRWKAGFHKESS